MTNHIDPTHYQLEKAGIKHFCHYSSALNVLSTFSLGDAALLCTECRLDRGEFTLADILLGRVDPCDRQQAFDEAARRGREDRELRELGKLPKHVLYTAYQKGNVKGEKFDPPIPYERYDCKFQRGSASATPDRICTFCKETIDQ